MSTTSPLADKFCVVSCRLLLSSGKLAGAGAEDTLISSLVEDLQVLSLWLLVWGSDTLFKKIMSELKKN